MRWSAELHVTGSNSFRQWRSAWQESLNVGLCAQGFAVQGYVTGEGPYANWAKHVSDPCAPTALPT